MIDASLCMESSRKRATVLIVDDQPVNIQALSGLLKDEFHIQVATSGPKALTIAQGSKPPDLVLLDIQMPGMDGYEVCRKLKANELSRNIPIIFVTAKNSDLDEEIGLNMGAVDYISKPLRPAIVLARVRNHINLKIKTDWFEQLSLLDALTNIPNRRAFDDYCLRAWGMAQRNADPISAIMIDIDHFKQYNDHYGHGVGDECLIQVAHALVASINRKSDLLARYGGEEFAAILPGTDADGALLVAQKFKEGIESLAIQHEYSSAAKVITVSIGVATHDVGDKIVSTDILFKAADKALYLAKQRQRNRIEFFDKDHIEELMESNGS